MDKQREDFLDWHFLDWKLSNANDDSVEFARELYNRVHKHSHNQFFRARELKAWQQAQKVAVPEGFVLMPRICTNKMAHAAKAIDGRLSAFKYADVYKAMIEAQEDST